MAKKQNDYQKNAKLSKPKVKKLVKPAAKQLKEQA